MLFMNSLRIRSKFCLTATLDTFNAFTVNYSMKHQQQCFQDCQIKTIRPNKAYLCVYISISIYMYTYLKNNKNSWLLLSALS